MVPLDGSPFGEYALPLALGIARRAGAEVELIHVYTLPIPSVLTNGLVVPVPVEPPPEQAWERARAYLDQLADCLSERWEVPIEPVVRAGAAADTLYHHALASNTDLVVMTTHGYGPLSRLWLGSVADQLMRRLPMPLLLVWPHEAALDLLEEVHEQAFQHVLIPLDGSPLAEEVLEPAMALGKLMDAEYTLLQAIDPPLFRSIPAVHASGVDKQILEQSRAEALAYLEGVAERMRAEGLQVHTSVLHAPPSVAILDYAHEHAVDLIAMATHGRGGVARMLLGSVADKVVRGAGAPVLLQRPSAETAELSIDAQRGIEDRAAPEASAASSTTSVAR
jgi:nucleotide-binding universal stress UspA family protein